MKSWSKEQDKTRSKFKRKDNGKTKVWQKRKKKWYFSLPSLSVVVWTSSCITFFWCSWRMERREFVSLVSSWSLRIFSCNSWFWKRQSAQTTNNEKTNKQWKAKNVRKTNETKWQIKQHNSYLMIEQFVFFISPFWKHFNPYLNSTKWRLSNGFLSCFGLCWCFWRWSRIRWGLRICHQLFRPQFLAIYSQPICWVSLSLVSLVSPLFLCFFLRFNNLVLFFSLLSLCFFFFFPNSVNNAEQKTERTRAISKKGSFRSWGAKSKNRGWQ